MDTSASWTAGAALTVSLIALAVSALNAWFSTLRPPELIVDFNFLAVGDPGGGVGILIPTTITNIGARGTTITDVALIETCGEEHCFFASWFTIKSDSVEAFFKSPPAVGSPSPYIDRTNAAYHVPGKAEVFHTYFFQPKIGKPSVDDNAVCHYRIVVRSPHGEWFGDGTVAWPADTKKAVIVGKALLINVQEALLWQELTAEAMSKMRYAEPTKIIQANSIGVYAPHAPNTSQKAAPDDQASYIS